MEGNGADTRMMWTGNRYADRVMEYGVVLPANHGVNDDDVDHIWATASSFLAPEGLRA
jgi:hypothetical protein